MTIYEGLTSTVFTVSVTCVSLFSRAASSISALLAALQTGDFRVGDNQKLCIS